MKRHQSKKRTAKGVPFQIHFLTLNQSAQPRSKQDTKISLHNCDVAVVSEKIFMSPPPFQINLISYRSYE